MNQKSKKDYSTQSKNNGFWNRIAGILANILLAVFGFLLINGSYQENKIKRNE